MRDLIIIGVIIVLIIAGDVGIKKYLYKTADELIYKLEDLKQKTITAKEDNNRTEIKNSADNIENMWRKKSEMWSTIVMHQELDNVEQAMIKAKSNIEDGELEVAIQEIETSIFFLNHVKEREKVSLKNIF